MALSNLADIDMAEKNYRAAEPLYEQALGGFPATRWANGVGQAHAALKLGEIRVIQNRYSEAEPPLLESLAISKKRPVVPNKPLTEALTHLATAYDGLGQPEKAKTYRQELFIAPK